MREEKNIKMFGIKIDPDKHEKLKEHCRREGFTMSYLFRNIIDMIISGEIKLNVMNTIVSNKKK